MALIKCKECGSQVSTEAASCPSCGAKPKKRTSLGRRILYCFLAFYLVVMVMKGIFTDPSTTYVEAPKVEPTVRPCEEDTLAFVMSQEFVKEKLKSPSTAKFPYITSDGVGVKHLSNCSYGVTAYVDAQNAFGGLIRTRYYVEIRKDTGTGHWKLIKVTMDDR